MGWTPIRHRECGLEKEVKNEEIKTPQRPLDPVDPRPYARCMFAELEVDHART